MLKPNDIKKPTDAVKPPRSTELMEKTQAQVERTTKLLERQGVEPQEAQSIAAQIDHLAQGPIAHDDWMKLDVTRFAASTQESLEKDGLTADAVLSDPDKAEAFVGKVLAAEGVPDGNGGTEKVRDVVPGHYDQAGHGIDLVAADAQGIPIVVEVKKYNQTSAAKLSDRDIVKLEPAVERWRAQREARAQAFEEGDPNNPLANAPDAWKPEVADQRRQAQADKAMMAEHSDELSVQQMDDLWVRDRWLKLVKSSDRRKDLQRAGVEQKYMDYGKLSNADPNCPEWQAILERRATVIVSGGAGDTGKRLFNQATLEGRSKRVIKIEF